MLLVGKCEGEKSEVLKRIEYSMHWDSIKIFCTTSDEIKQNITSVKSMESTRVREAILKQTHSISASCEFLPNILS